jgi:hypothetical protein
MRKASTRLPEQGTQTPSPAPDLIPAEVENQPRTRIAIGTANGGTSGSARTKAKQGLASNGLKPSLNGDVYETMLCRLQGHRDFRNF